MLFLLVSVGYLNANFLHIAQIDDKFLCDYLHQLDIRFINGGDYAH